MLQMCSLFLVADTEKAEQQRKKLSYYDPTINVLSCQKRWEEILLEPSVSDEELQLALLRGKLEVLISTFRIPIYMIYPKGSFFHLKLLFSVTSFNPPGIGTSLCL